MVDQFDWNAIDGILFRFSGNSPYDEQLNAVYSMIMDDIDMADLFVENADAKVLAPFMMTNLRGSVANSITYCLPSLTDSQKGHITQLLSGCTISYVTYTGATKNVRGPIDLEKAAKEALTHHTHASTKPIISIELIITEWQFKSTWRAHRFDKVYAIPIPVPSSRVGIPPVKPRESLVELTIQEVHAQANNSIINTPVPSGTPSLVHTKTVDSNAEGTPVADVNAIVPSPHATIPSDAPKMVDSNAVATPVKALSGTPANFRRTCNPQRQSVVFHRLPQTVSLPKSLIASCPKQVMKVVTRFVTIQTQLSRKSPKPVSGISKRHRDALKVNLYHLYANILSMNWFYDTFD